MIELALIVAGAIYLAIGAVEAYAYLLWSGDMTARAFPDVPRWLHIIGNAYMVVYIMVWWGPAAIIVLTRSRR